MSKARDPFLPQIGAPSIGTFKKAKCRRWLGTTWREAWRQQKTNQRKLIQDEPDRRLGGPATAASAYWRSFTPSSANCSHSATF